MIKVFRLARETIRKFIDDGCATYAAALTYVTLLALIPFFVIFFTVLSIFKPFKFFFNQIEDFVFHHFVASSAHVIHSNLAKFVEQGTRLSTISTFALLITAILMVYNIASIFDKIWGVSERSKNIYSFLKYALIVILTPLIIAAILLLSNYFILIPYVSAISFLFPFIIMFFTFTFLFYLTPNSKFPFLVACISAFITLILFELAKSIFAFYIQYFANYDVLYGIFSAIPVFLIWIYVFWFIVLFGVEMSYILTIHYFKKISP